MATIDIGKIKQVWRGTYASGTAYTPDDVVQYTDSGLVSSYICIANTTGNAPSSSGTAHGSWNYLAKGGVAGSNGTDVGATLANKEIAFKTNAGAVDGIPIGTAGQFLKVNSGATGYEYGAVASKLLGNTITVDQTAVNFGDTNRTSAALYTQLSTTHTAQSTASYFVIRINAHGGTQNHQKLSIEWSKDNSNWYHTSEAGNAGFTAVSLSGYGINWASGLRYTHPQASFGTDGDTNRNEPTTATMVLKPSGSTHSVTTLYIRVWVFQTNDSGATYINRNQGNSTDDGVICSSALEINEYAL